MDRREFLEFLGRASSAAALGPVLSACSSLGSKSGRGGLPFEPLAPSQDDAVHLPRGFAYRLMIQEGAPLNSSGLVFGSDNDYTAFFEVPGRPLEGLLWVNHEFVEPLFVSGWDGKPENRTLEQVRKEQPMVGGSIVHIRRESEGSSWEFVPNSSLNKRLDANTRIPLLAERAISGSRVAIGTFGNCAGGKTPWGTALTCEENTDKFYGEMDYTGRQPRKVNRDKGLAWGLVEDRSPEHYGWVVEVNPWTGKAHKLCGLGRFAHECATCVPARDGRTVVYMGDDCPDQFIYKFISARPGSLEKGTLYVANTVLGRWLPLDIRTQGKLRDKFKDQTEVLVRAREAAALLGATPQDRPEDLERDPVTGHILVTTTNNKKRGNPFGAILKIVEKDNDYLATEFTASVFMAGGPEAGFACPDNMAFDARGNLWFTCDVSDRDMNKPPYTSFGNNALFYVPMSGPHAGQPLRFATAPVGAEFTGPSFSPDGRTLFLCVQHPGEGTTDIAQPKSLWPSGQRGDLPKSAVLTVDVGRLMSV